MEKKGSEKRIKCRSCGAPIIFIGTPKGRRIPCDAEPVTYWQKEGGSAKVVTPNGEVVSAELEGDLQEATGLGYISHFATCPNANKHRKS